jgi:hypothetical protein
MAEFDAKPHQRRERVDDDSTAVAGVMIAFLGIQLDLNGAVDADRVPDALILALGVRGAGVHSR